MPPGPNGRVQFAAGGRTPADGPVHVAAEVAVGRHEGPAFPGDFHPAAALPALAPGDQPETEPLLHVAEPAPEVPVTYSHRLRGRAQRTRLLDPFEGAVFSVAVDRATIEFEPDPQS